MGALADEDDAGADCPAGAPGLVPFETWETRAFEDGETSAELCAVNGTAAQMTIRAATDTHQRFIMPPEQDDNSKL